MQRLFLRLLLVTCCLSCAWTSAIPRRKPGLITSSLRRHHNPRTDVHPRLLMQQYINRASKRLSRMTGRQGPSEHELRSEIHKRLHLIGNVATGLSVSGGNPRTGFPAGNGHSGNHIVLPGNQASTNNTGVCPLDIQAANNGTMTPANPPVANHSLGLDIYADDVAYLATIQLGTPFRNFTVAMDTGSADFWVTGEHCNSTDYGDCGNHTALGPQSSSSFVANNTNFLIQYGSGDVSGYLCQDRVMIADMTLNNHTFGVSTAESQQFADPKLPIDGLMGLAQMNLSEQRVPTPVQSLFSAKLIASPVVSFKISRLADELNDGEVTFGGLDQSKYNASTLTTFPSISQRGFWEGAIDAVFVNGTDAGFNGRSAILDTGTTLMLVPQADAQQLVKDLGGSCDSQQCTIPCTTNASLAFSFGKSNSTFAIDPRDLAVLPIDMNNPTGDCFAGVQPGQFMGASEWLVGDVFLKNAYFSVDLDKNEISLAQFSTS